MSDECVSKRIARRNLLVRCGAVALTVKGGRLHAQEKLAPLVIGVLTDRSGLGSVVSGPPLVQAVRMAVSDAGSMPDGRPVAVVTDAFVLKADDALAICRRWFDQGVSAVVDVPGANAASAVQDLARSRQRSTLITGSINPELSGQACSPFGSLWSIDSSSMARAIVGSLARAGRKTWFLVVPDSVLGLSVQADLVKAIEAFGGRLIGESRHPPDATDYRSVIDQIQSSGADTVVLCDINQPLVAQLGQFQTANLFGNGRSAVVFLPTLTDVHAAGPQAAQGLLLASPFYWDQNDQARSFASRFFAAAGQMPDAPHAAAYVAVKYFLRAVAATESLSADLINQEMRRSPVYFFGRSAKLRLDGRLAVDMSLFRVKSRERMHGDWDHYEPVSGIAAADIYPSVTKSGCSFVL